MSLFNKYFEDVVKELIGGDAVPLVAYITDKDSVSEFKIAEILDIDINRTRNILYRLSAHNLVSSSRKKDKKKGWYNYSWTLNLRRAFELVVGSKRRRIDFLGKQLKKLEEESFFYCPEDNLTLNFESAMEQEFKCPEDGNVLLKKDFSKDIKKIKSEIDNINTVLAEESLKVLEEEVVGREEKMAKKKVKKAERAKARKEAKKEKEDQEKPKKVKEKKKVKKKLKKKKIKKKLKKKVKKKIKKKKLKKKLVKKKVKTKKKTIKNKLVKKKISKKPKKKVMKKTPKTKIKKKKR